MKGKYVQYGCGLSAPADWDNFDISPTLRIQKTPVIGTLLGGLLNVKFPENVKYGDVVTGLPILDNSCDGIYCSHVLEHLALNDFKLALKNTYKLIKPNGIFRCVVPDLEVYARTYIIDIEKGDSYANGRFLNDSLLGHQQRSRGLKGLLANLYGNSNHLWMWDFQSLSNELAQVGFRNIRRCQFNDSIDGAFKSVENAGRFERAVSIECIK